MLPVSRTAARSAPGWRNWGGTAACTPNQVLHPASAAEIADIVRETAARGGTVKTVGAGHSFSPIAVADDVQLDLSRLRGLVAGSVEADDEAAGDAQPQQTAGPVPDKSAEVRAAITDTQQGLLEAQLAQLSALGSAGAGNGGGGSGNLRWRGAPVFRSADGYFTFKPRGRLSLDWSGTEGSSFDARNIYGTEATDLRLGAEGIRINCGGRLGGACSWRHGSGRDRLRQKVVRDVWAAAILICLQYSIAPSNSRRRISGSKSC